MTKPINIPLKATGAEEAKAKLDGVAASAKGIGDAASQTKTRGERAFDWVKQGLASMIGPLGFAAVAGVIAGAAMKVAHFFDNIKKLSDEHIEKIKQMRVAYAELFEVLDAFDEKSRQQVTAEATRAFKKAAITEAEGLPVYTAYERQFQPKVKAGEMTKAEFEAGRQHALEYASLYGGPATAELVRLMAGLKINRPEEQAKFGRMVTAAGGAAGMTHEETVQVMQRSMSKLQMMGWSPQKSLEMLMTIAAGETGRQKTVLPTATVEALEMTQITDEQKRQYKISKAGAENSRALFEELAAKQGAMPKEAFNKMLIDIYGNQAAIGISKLMREGIEAQHRAVEEGIGPSGIKKEVEGLPAKKEALEGMTAITEGTIKEILQPFKKQQAIENEIRRIGQAEMERRRIEEPLEQKWQEVQDLGQMEKRKENAAREYWLRKMSPQERKETEDYLQTYKRPIENRGFYYQEFYTTEKDFWYQMTPEEKYQALTGEGPTVPERFKKQPVKPKAAPQAAPEPEAAPQTAQPPEAVPQAAQGPQTGGGKMGQSPPPLEITPQIEAAEPEAVEVTPQIETMKPETIQLPQQKQPPKPQTTPQAAPEPEMQPQTAQGPQTGGGKTGQAPPPLVNNYYTTQQHHYDHSMHFYPSTGEIERGPRFRQV